MPQVPHAPACREQAGAQQHRAVRALRLSEAAAALEAEAATWELLWHLYAGKHGPYLSRVCSHLQGQQTTNAVQEVVLLEMNNLSDGV